MGQREFVHSGYSARRTLIVQIERGKGVGRGLDSQNKCYCLGNALMSHLLIKALGENV